MMTDSENFPEGECSAEDESVGPFTCIEYSTIEECLDILASCDVKSSDYLVKMVIEKMDQLFKIHALALQMPELGSEFEASTKDESFRLLINDLLKGNPEDFELKLPIRTIMGKALIDMEISFWGYLWYTLSATDMEKSASELSISIQNFLSDRIFNKMTAELLLSVCTNYDVEPVTRKEAVKYLLTLWEDTSLRAMRSFAPLMESIWRARSQAKIILGTMMGIREILDLLAHGATPHFLEFLSKNSENQDIIDAFREFIFGATYEELRLKDEIQKKDGVVCKECEDPECTGGIRVDYESPRESTLGIYRFFNKRRLEAVGRQITGLPGPKRTAEEYLLIYFIENKL
ncbi:hypothetical protein KKF34_08690 [Myxococcota bacterium]|nr:hypothetical protein [Myxococcota bacterium]MBU1496941.1 hypothetical protein [Myxococcota bacterium]